MNKLNGRYTELLEQIASYESQYSRPSGAVKLLAVSKKKPVDDILSLYKCGQHDFAENYLQEALTKISTISNHDLNWHFIGPIQSNKTRAIAEYFNWVHSIDRLKIAQRLSNARPAEMENLNVCIQVNISEELSKSGIRHEELCQFAEQITELPGLTLRGLMGLPKPCHDFDTQYQQCSQLAQLYEYLLDQGYELDTLSMGTSNDIEAAIAAGSTMVRIGTTLFGARD